MLFIFLWIWILFIVVQTLSIKKSWRPFWSLGRRICSKRQKEKSLNLRSANVESIMVEILHVCWQKSSFLVSCRRWTSMRSWGWQRPEKAIKAPVPLMNFYRSLKYVETFITKLMLSVDSCFERNIQSFFFVCFSEGCKLLQYGRNQSRVWG